jgi:hypothetical protein
MRGLDLRLDVPLLVTVASVEGGVGQDQVGVGEDC